MKRNFYYSTFLLLLIVPLTAKSITVTFSVINASCGQNNGIVTALVTGGMPPYNFVWSNGAINNPISNLSQGTYTVTVTDMAGTSATNSAIVTMDSQLAFTSDGGPAMGESPTGRYDINILNGTAPFTINATCAGWNPSQSTSFSPNITLMNLFGYAPAYSPGMGCNPTFNGIQYGVVITDANGCSLTAGTTIGATGFYLNPQTTPSCGNTGTGKIIDTARFNNGAFPFVPTSGIVYVMDSSNTVVDSAYLQINPFEIPYEIDSLPAGDYTLEYHLIDLYNPVVPTFLPWIFLSAQVSVGDLGPNCGVVSGTAYYDANGNCNRDAGEIILSQSLIEIQPGNRFTLCDSAGNYSFALPGGTFDIKHHPAFNAQVTTVCPALEPFTFSITAPQQQVQVDFADSSGGRDLSVILYMAAVRPGLPTFITVNVRNISGTASYNDTLDVFFDSQLLLNAALPAPLSSTFNSVRFAIDSVPAFTQKSFRLNLLVPNDTTLLGTTVSSNAVLITSGDVQLINNTDSVNRIVTGSYDPNRKTVAPAGFGNQHHLPNTEYQLEYLIEFQNTGTDTAFTVIIEDTLSPYLDLSSFTPLASSHSYTMELVNNLLSFRFYNILLPDSNANEPESHGFISYRIHLLPDLAAGTVVTGTASIYFDLNVPVVTDTCFLTLYDCDSLFSSLPMNILACENSTISFGATTSIDCPLVWTMDGTVVSTGSSVSLPSLIAGQHMVIAEAQTPYCNQSQQYEINVATLPEAIVTVDADTLHCDPNGVSYQWFLEGIAIPGAVNPDYIASVSGNYSVQITSFIGCVNTSVPVYVSITGIEDIRKDALTLYPNPGSNFLTIRLPENTSTANDVRMLAADGKTVLQLNGVAEKTIQIGTGHLQNGIYQVVVTNGNIRLLQRWTKM